MFRKTHTKEAPWHLVPANDKHYARSETLRIIASRFGNHSRWMESKAQEAQTLSLKAALKKLGHRKV
jgi:hypothetical protein